MFRFQRSAFRVCPTGIRLMSGELGSGAGKGGGGGGAIRNAGGSFGKMEAAHEEEYFYKQTREQLKHLKDQHAQHSEQIKVMEKQLSDLEKSKKSKK